MRFTHAIVAGGALLAASNALAQRDEIHNPGFEIEHPLDGPQAAEGWILYDIPFAERRTLDDGDTPPALVRTGDASLALNGGKDFVGASTDTLDENFEYYNLNYTWGNTATFSGWYAIPAEAPVELAKAGLKLEFRRPEPDNSIYQSFEILSIDGHTDGEWVYFELVVGPEDFVDFPPYANRVSLLPLRFGSGSSTGTIFWDDLAFEQTGGGDCYADFTGDGALDLFDFLSYVNAFNAGQDNADCDNDGDLTLFDFLCFVNAFNAGC
jgi:hypothetical protein